MFDDDDDDVLSGMGLSSPRHKSPTRASKAKTNDDDHRPGGAKSIMDELLGGNTVNKHLEQPGTGGKIENLFEKKLASSGKHSTKGLFIE